ncbi:nitrile hydratase subunit alpha [Rhodococcus pyridinivorans]|uniref:nitrile hydratase subunit alpha n=1 Tax=Rhodococcus pyridinivorans TaxID=103816 RepID=UPI000166D866|nr:nitrile hydratase subunit alpha [Rhodococcus pyridinivorans]USI92956.1 nitrile hydratase subunit alpha [Rhodococcus pyridinivorans]
MSNRPKTSEEITARVKALESILIEKGVVTTSMIDRFVEIYEHEVGPQLGAKIVARAWTDPEYKARLLADATEACKEMGASGLQGEDMVALEDTDEVHHAIVCTLCSCYPWPVLGLPPNWYKDPQYRSRMIREPRQLLEEEFGYKVPEHIEIRVWDSSSEMRYWVLPQRPAGTEGWSAEALAELVTRDSLIGVGPTKSVG